VKSYKHLFERVSSFDNLHAAARAAWKGKRGKAPAAAFFSRFEDEIVALREELLSGSYRPGSYQYFTVREPKERRVAAAPFRDRVLHHALVRVLEPIFENRFIEDSFACRKGRGTHAAMRRAQHFAKRYRYALKCDIRKYFPSIDHAVLLSQLGRVVADRRLLDLIGRILESHCDAREQVWEPGGDLFSVVERRRGVPIGNHTSQFFANIYLNDLDHFVKHDLRVRGYARYVDDFLLFGDDRAELKRLGREVRGKVEELQLRMNPDKYRLVHTNMGVDFVGFVVFPDGRRRIRSSSARRFERRLRRLRWEASRGERTWEAVTRSVRSWVAHAEHAQSYGLRRRLLSRV